MAPTLDVSVYPDEGRMLLEVRDAAVDLDPATAVERDDGKGYAVRRYATILDTARHKVWADYEVPIDRQVTYRIAGTATTATATLPSNNGATWWKPLPYPSLGMPVDVLSYMEDGTSDTETVDVWPLGAQSPVTVYGARRYLAGTVVVGLWTAVDAGRFQDGLRRSPVVLLQPPGKEQVYLTIKGVQVRRMRRLASPERIYTMEAQVRDAPVVEWSYPATATWASYDTEATWADWRDNGPTWLDVLLGVS